jgi:hypothetical protein
VQVTGQIYIVDRVDARYDDQPVLYHLRDLMDDKIPGSYYREQLVKTEKPDFNNFFTIRVSCLETL